MKRITSLLMFACVALFANAANYYTATDPLIGLIAKMDSAQGPRGDAAWCWINQEGEHLLYSNPDSYANFQLLSANNLGIYVSANIESNGSTVSWATCNCGTYGILRGIDWTDKNYLQKSGSENNIVFEHVANADNDLSFVEFLKLSGNRFRNIEIKGNDGMTRLTEIDLSDNATLEYLKISGCPNLKTIKATATTVEIAGAYLFSALSQVSATNFTYNYSGTVNLTFPVNAVDLSVENTTGTSFANWSTAPVSSNNGVFAFADNQTGQTVTVELTNAGYPGITVQVSITLADGDYRITTAAELDDVRNHLGGKFTLDADIDLTDYLAEGGDGYAKWGNEGWMPIGDGINTAFRGTFDGNGHTISGLWINRPSTVYVGLFGGVGYYRTLTSTDGAGAVNGPDASNTTSTFGATIKDLAIIAGSISGDYNVGALAGAIGNSIITGIYVNAIVVGKNESGHGYNIGGLTGSFWGRNNTTLLQDCYTTGKVTGRRGVGGILGSTFQNDVTINIKRVYSTATAIMAEGSAYYMNEIGGVIGAYQSPTGLVKINSSFAINDTIIGQQAKGEGRTGRFLGGYKASTGSNVFADSIFSLKNMKVRLYNHTGDYSNIYYEIDPNDTITSADLTAANKQWRQRQAVNKIARQLIQQSTYAEMSSNAALNWDFSETWTMGNGCYPLPVLKRLPASVQPAEYPAHLKFDVSVATSVTGETGGSISTHAGVKAGDDVTVTITPDTDYAVDAFTVNSEDKKAELVGNEYALACIKGDAVINVTFKSTLPVYTGTGVWTNAENWSTEAVPASTDKVIIDGDITIADNLEIAGIIINAGKSVTVNAGKQLTVSDTLAIDGTLNLQSDAAGTATILTAKVGGSGTANVQQYLSTENERERYYLSSPVTGASSMLFGENDKVGYYDETTHAYTNYFPENHDTTLVAGRGYVVLLAAGNPTCTFSGTLNNGKVEIPVTRTGTEHAKRGFNLVGNPYPSYLDWDAVASENVQSTIWTSAFEAGNMIFKTYNADAQVGTDDETIAHIAPLQAFWVKVPAEKADVTGLTLDFTNALRLHKGDGDAPLLSSKAENRPLLRLQISNGTVSDKAVILFDENAQDGFDRFDSEKMSNCNVAVPEIYTLSTEKLAINGMNALNARLEIPVGITIGEAGTYSISASQVDNIDLPVVLKDNVTSTEFDLAEDGSYEFTSDAADNASRFTLAFAKTTTGAENAETGKLSVHVVNDKIIVKQNAEILKSRNFEIYNSLGRRISNYGLSAGVYVIKAGNETVKVVVK